MALRDRLDPFQLAQAIEQKLERLYALATHPRPAPKPNVNGADLPPVEQQAIRTLPQSFGIPVYVGRQARRPQEKVTC